jgi:hypothetical protein
MRLSGKIAAAILLSAVTTACDRNSPTEAACDTSLRPSIIVEARDASGRAAAVGATLTIVGATDILNHGGPVKGFVDSLTILAGGNTVSGPMDVTISKPWHNTSSVRGLRMATGPCGVITPARIGFTLRRAVNAPRASPGGCGSGEARVCAVRSHRSRAGTCTCG